MDDDNPFDFPNLPGDDAAVIVAVGLIAVMALMIGFIGWLFW